MSVSVLSSVTVGGQQVVRFAGNSIKREGVRLEVTKYEALRCLYKAGSTMARGSDSFVIIVVGPLITD